jgi:hypothetical protein
LAGFFVFFTGILVVEAYLVTSRDVLSPRKWQRTFAKPTYKTWDKKLQIENLQKIKVKNAEAVAGKKCRNCHER